MAGGDDGEEACEARVLWRVERRAVSVFCSVGVGCPVFGGVGLVSLLLGRWELVWRRYLSIYLLIFVCSFE